MVHTEDKQLPSAWPAAHMEDRKKSWPMLLCICRFVCAVLASKQNAGAKIVVTARTDHQLECTRVGPRLHALDEMLQVHMIANMNIVPV